MKRLGKLIKLMGPGLLYAGAAVGVSHLVQSTRAGADFGFALIWAIVLANVMKYPFFQFAPRYTAATGKNLIEGYRILGRWAVVMFLIITVLTMFAIMAAITIVTSGLIIHIFGISLNSTLVSGLLLTFTALMLILGRYSILDRIIKLVILLLTISTIVALVAAMSHGYAPQESFAKTFDISYFPHLAFLIALFGWMPAPLDISVWQSLWAKAKHEEQGVNLNKKQALLDFNIGYIGTALLAIGFLSLGAFVMYGNPEEMSSNGAEFAGQLINMYTVNLGGWSYIFIATAALMTMLSTSFTCHDAYARVMSITVGQVFSEDKKPRVSPRIQYIFWLVVLLLGTVFILGYLAENMRLMVDFATVLSFIIAPAFGILNYKLITHQHVPKADQPSRFLRIYAIVGIVLLTGFSLYYIYFRLITLL